MVCRKKSNGVSKAMREREKGFSLSAADAEVPAYNSLYDQDLRHYFDNRCEAPIQEQHWEGRGRGVGGFDPFSHKELWGCYL